MIKATAQDKSLVISLLTESFKDNQSVNYIIRQDKYKISRLHALMEYSFDMCFLLGEVYLSEDRLACALWLPPQTKRTTFHSIWLDIKLIINVIGISQTGLVLKREAAIKAIQPKDPAYYLWFIGVDPEYQHIGIGTKLLNELITNAQKNALPMILETSTVKNLSWYERAGFSVYNTLDLGYTLYFLRNCRNGEYG